MTQKRRVSWIPDYGRKDGPQARFLRDLHPVYEVLNAGGLGSGKTEAGIMGAVVYPEYKKIPKYKGLLVRYAEKDLAKEIVYRIQMPHMYPAYVGGEYVQADQMWRTAAGGLIVCSHAKELRSLHGQEFAYCYIDELPHWPGPKDDPTAPAEEYRFIMTRLRSPIGLPVRLRAGANAISRPVGPGKPWVKFRWGPWLDPEYLSPRGAAPARHHKAARSLRALGYLPRPDLPPCASGHVLYYMVDDNGDDLWVPEGTPGALSRSCLRSKTTDNPAWARDPQMMARVRSAGPTMYAQAILDDWSAEDPDEGFFQRGWFPVVSPAAVPALAGTLRRWDLAWTKKKGSDWTVGVKLGWTADGDYYVLHVVRIQGTPDEVYKVVKQTADADGRAVPIRLPIDPAAGIATYGALTRLLAGYWVQGDREREDKHVRISTLQPQAEAGRIKLVSGEWTQAYLDEAARYPKGHDDQLDATAGAYLWVVGSRQVSIEDVERDAEAWAGLAQDRGDRSEFDRAERVF